MIKTRRLRLPRRLFLAGMGAVAAGIQFVPRHALAAEDPKLNFYTSFG